MISPLRLLVILLIAGSLSAHAADKPTHLFILSGQSNMAGMKPEAGFVPEAAKLFPEADVAYIKVAQGGEPIRYWVEEWNEIAAKHGIDSTAARSKDKKPGTIYYQTILDQFSELLTKHSNPVSVTFCWMQGERDAKESLDAAYEEALKQLIANLRRDLELPQMKVVIARLSDWGKPDNSPWQAVRDAQVAIAATDPQAAWVDCDDLNNKEKNGKAIDDLHYTPEGYAVLGQRYARQAKALVEGTEPAQDGRP